MDLALQLMRLQQSYPDSMVWLSGGELHWRGTLQPTVASRRYRVRLLYRVGDSIPRCYVIEPGLRALVAASSQPGRPLPHVYSAEGDPLCLFTDQEWNATMAIADTTIPWASLWLRFFETWLVTNTWEGSGAPYRGDAPSLPTRAVP